MVRQARADWSLPPSLATHDDLTVCVRRFGVPDPKEPWKGDLTKHIVSARLSPDRPRDLLVSYSDDALYLFDTDAETFVRAEKPRQPRADEMWRGGGERSEDDEHGSPRGGEDSDEADIAGQQEMEGIETEDEAEPANTFMQAEGARGQTSPSVQESEPTTGEHNEDDDDDDDDDDDEMSEDDDDEEGLLFDPFVKPAKLAPHSKVPMVAPWRKYDGHANSQVRAG